MTTLRLLFEFARDTKNTAVFKEVLSKEHTAAAIGTLYVQKPVHKQLGSPKSLSVVLGSAAGTPESLV